MTNKNDSSTAIATLLRTIGSKKCLAKAEMLEGESAAISALHLRDLGLTSSDVVSIMSCLKQGEDSNDSRLKSISFSYNRLLGDEGAIALAKSLPTSIREIGLVACGISDIGGIEILNELRALPQLQMICIEQNDFSEQLRSEFKAFSVAKRHIMVVY